MTSKKIKNIILIHNSTMLQFFQEIVRYSRVTLHATENSSSQEFVSNKFFFSLLHSSKEWRLFVISRISPFPHACYAATIVSKPIPIPSTHAPRKINCGLFRVDSEDASIGWLIRYRLPPLAAGIRAPVVMARHRSDECCLCCITHIN